MSDDALIVGLPSKGRLREQTEAWLATCGLGVERIGGDRAYTARLRGVAQAEVRLLSAREIALGLEAGEIHVGVTGDDLIAEVCEDPDERVDRLRGLGFGRADLVVAAPRAWIDVGSMADLEDVAARERARRGRQLLVATKYARSTRRFFAARGLVDYRIVESHGATEGAPAAGLADVIVDITTTGRTLAANHLKVLDDGLILESQARLTAALHAEWSAAALAGLKRWLDVARAREAGAEHLHVRARADASVYADLAERFGCRADPDGHGALCPRPHLADVCAQLNERAGEPVIVTAVEHLFEPTNLMYERFTARLSSANRPQTD